jgi:hypothetical protein
MRSTSALVPGITHTNTRAVARAKKAAQALRHITGGI